MTRRLELGLSMTRLNNALVSERERTRRAEERGPSAEHSPEFTATVRTVLLKIVDLEQRLRIARAVGR